MPAIPAFRALHKTWMKLQVELHGKYSLKRVHELHAYSSRTSWIRILCCCVAVPIPCLVFNILLDVGPLADPSAGREANWVFWIRCFIFLLVMTYGTFSEIRFLTPPLGMTSRDVLFTDIIATTLSVVYYYILAGYITMPIPFFFLIGTPPFLLATGTIFAILFGKKLQQDAKVRAAFIQTGGVFMVQSGLQVVYPLYIFGFNFVPSKYQAVYIACAPLLKIAFKNSMARFVTDDDFKPEALIFIVDMFHALYVSLAMQRTSTISTSLLIIAVDALQACVSVYDVYTAYQPIQRFLSKLPQNHPFRKQSFLDIAVAIDPTSSGKDVPKLTMGTLPAKTQSVQVAPRVTTANRVYPMRQESPCESQDEDSSPGTVTAILSVGDISKTDRRNFVEAVTRLLFTIEFVMLTEYTEVIIPIFYSIVMETEYHSPNRRFYTNIADVNDIKLQSMVTHVLSYAGLEFASLMVFSYVLQRITGVSPMRQVGFVLEQQFKPIQAKLFVEVLYAIQNSLQHLGADYSFQFKWLRGS